MARVATPSTSPATTPSASPSATLVTEPLQDADGYLSRMAMPLLDKLRMATLIPSCALAVLDAGCADGTLTIALAEMFPKTQFLGIDLNAEFIELAKMRSRHLSNVKFECVYLRDLLSRETRYDVVQFCSVLHEFASYGEGISSVVKALADAHELLKVGGTVNIRDMILEEYARHSDFHVEALREKIYANAPVPGMLDEFIALHGELDCLHNANHFLLKYMYEDNWHRECAEDYLPVSLEEYRQIFSLLGMRLSYHRSELLPYLHDKWISDFGFTEDEISGLRSTTVLLAKK